MAAIAYTTYCATTDTPCSERDGMRFTARRVETATRVQDLVRLLQDLAKRAPTEDVVSHISSAIREYGISEAALERISQMHRLHANDDGVHGYAITLIWSTVVHSVVHDGILIHVD